MTNIFIKAVTLGGVVMVVLFAYLVFSSAASIKEYDRCAPAAMIVNDVVTGFYCTRH